MKIYCPIDVNRTVYVYCYSIIQYITVYCVLLRLLRLYFTCVSYLCFTSVLPLCHLCFICCSFFAMYLYVFASSFLCVLTLLHISLILSMYSTTILPAESCFICISPGCLHVRYALNMFCDYYQASDYHSCLYSIGERICLVFRSDAYSHQNQ